jgi:hypothetical protein
MARRARPATTYAPCVTSPPLGGRYALTVRNAAVVGVLSVLWLGVSCGTVVGEIPFAIPGAGQTAIVLDPSKPVRFWSEFDARYTGVLRAAYNIVLVQDGVPVSAAVCYPIASRTGGHRVCTGHVEGWSSHYGNCEMWCSASVPRTGPTEIRATLTFGGQPVGFELDRADLIVRQ